MSLLPILRREARLAAVKRYTYHLRWGVGAIGLFFIAKSLFVPVAWDVMGRDLFFKLSLLAQCIAVFAGALHTADTISQERREGTLRLLFLTPLKPRHIAAGKFLASCATPLTCLIAILPLLAIPLLLGGVPPARIAWMALHLLNTLFLSLAAGLLVSAYSTTSLSSITLSMLFAGALSFVPIGMTAMTANVYSPFDVFLDLTEISSPMDSAGFLRTLVMWNALAWIFLFLAALGAGKSTDGPATLRQEKTQRWTQSLRFGNRAQRARLRQKLLDQNPIAWLANRYQVSSPGLLIACFALHILPMLFSGSPHTWWYGNPIAHCLVALRMAAYATAQLSDDRKSGALELLLATPLSARELIAGRARGFLRVFFGPCLLLIAADLIMLPLYLAGFQAMPDDPWRTVMIAGRIVSFIQTFAVWAMLCWFGLWAGFRLQRHIAAISLTLLLAIASIILPPFIPTAGYSFGNTPPLSELLIAFYRAPAMTILILITAALAARHILTRTLRQNAASFPSALPTTFKS